MKFRVPLILTSLLLVAILMMGPVDLVSSAPSAGGASISMTGALVPEGGVEVEYTINYSGVTPTGGVELTIAGADFTASGFSQTSVPAATESDDNTLIWPSAMLDASGSGTITITGTFSDPETCDATVTFDATILDTHENPDAGSSATTSREVNVVCDVEGPVGCEEPDVFSVGSGDWNGGGQWNTGQVPGPNDVVWIRPGNQLRLYGTDTLRVGSLCNQGTLFSHLANSLIIKATGFVINYPGGLLRGEDGQAGTGNQGSTVIIQSPASDPDGVRITNRGQILAGDGANGPDFGGSGGSVALVGNHVENSFKGIITAGRGGNITGTDSGLAGHGGSVNIWSSAGIRLRNRITAGHGGNGNRPDATSPQDGGDAGCVFVMGSTRVDVRFSRIRSGRPGLPAAGGFRGFRCGVFIDPPDTIEVSGADIEGDVVQLYGGDDTDIDASGGMTTTTVISASEQILIAVGTNGTINLSNNDNLQINVTDEGGEVIVASDIAPTLDDGETLDDVVDMGTAVDEASQVLRNVAVAAPEVVAGPVDVPIDIDLAIQNNGPEQDEYNVTIKALHEWPRTVDGLPDPVTVTIGGLDQYEFQMTVTPTDTVPLITREVITITATSTDGEVIAQEVTEVHLQAEPQATAIDLTNTEAVSMTNWLWLLPAMLLVLVSGLMASWRLAATRVK